MGVRVENVIRIFVKFFFILYEIDWILRIDFVINF